MTTTMSSLMPWRKLLSSSPCRQTPSSTSQCTFISRTYLFTANASHKEILFNCWIPTGLSISLTMLLFNTLPCITCLMRCDEVIRVDVSTPPLLWNCWKIELSVSWTSSCSISFYDKLINFVFKPLCRRSSSNISGFNSEMCPDDQSVGFILGWMLKDWFTVFFQLKPHKNYFNHHLLLSI